MLNLSNIVSTVIDNGVEQGRITIGDEIVCSYPDRPRRILVHSIAKSVTSLAVGFGVSEGIMKLEECVTDAFADYMPAVRNIYMSGEGKAEAEKHIQRLSEIKVCNLLSMTSGMKNNFLTGFQRPYIEEYDWVGLSLTNPIVHEAGSTFMYNDCNYYLIAKLIQRRSGVNITEYLMPRLFDPLEIKYPTWELDPQGDAVGCGGLLFSLEELHKIGILCLNKGRYNGKEIIPAEWIKEITAPHIEIGGGCGYGYGFWTSPEYYYMFGLGGIYNFISPETETVVTAVGFDMPN